MSDRPPRFVRAQRLPIVNGILLLVILIVALQLWLFTATVNAYLGGDQTIIWPAAGVSVGFLALAAGLLRYLKRLD